MPQEQKMKLLPNHYKLVGGGVIVLGILTVLILPRIIGNTVRELNPNLGPSIFLGIINIGLFIIAFSKEKDEDERIVSIRLKSVFFAFGYAVLFSALNPITKLIFEDKDHQDVLSGAQLVLTMMIAYFGTFYLSKRRL